MTDTPEKIQIEAEHAARKMKRAPVKKILREPPTKKYKIMEDESSDLDEHTSTCQSEDTTDLLTEECISSSPQERRRPNIHDWVLVKY